MNEMGRRDPVCILTSPFKQPLSASGHCCEVSTRSQVKEHQSVIYQLAIRKSTNIYLKVSRQRHLKKG